MHYDDLRDNFNWQIKAKPLNNHPSNNNQDQPVRKAARCKSQPPFNHNDSKNDTELDDNNIQLTNQLTSLMQSEIGC